jgi:hypothetical protein
MGWAARPAMPDLTARCDLTDLLAASCAHCRNLPDLGDEAQADRARLLALPGWFAAEYPGYCSSCGERFEAGTAIRSVNGVAGLGGWRAECCAEVTRG